MMPVGMTGIRQLRQQILIQRAQQYLQELLPAACAGLSRSDLADGQAKFLTTTTRALINNRFSRYLPPLLAGKLRLTQVRFTTRRLTPDANHWMDDDQPQSQPIITCQAELSDYGGQVIIISQALEFLLD